jgi:ribosomal-protein-alanine N-acetyltransferase
MPGTTSVRPLVEEDAAPLAALYLANRDHLAPYEPTRDEEFYTVAGQRRRVASALADHEQGRGLPFVIEVDGRLAGRVNVTNIALGPFCSGSLGYWVAADVAGRGVATSAVRWVVDDCFTRHGLHRLEAGTLVDNVASQKVLERTGFTLIGRAPRYLRIAGQWRDHLLFQRLADDPATWRLPDDAATWRVADDAATWRPADDPATWRLPDDTAIWRVADDPAT